ncbi:protein ABA AND ROS SENSITIVE 1-like [Phragmites australis]|uniref:protein ABA AND ROS SENSITIVE 1-like n=1 Tax=Phragmites australis TaxID=29695 RepID=UPI002D7714A8|nr:protein ABA AND ROS SENSITIVE 1-like [Phragmites australis]
MDQRKAIFRAKLRETKEKQQKRIDPSLVRYNEYDQPICRVCNTTLKSEALWPAHQVSRKHHEAKAAAAAKAAAGAGSRGSNAKQEQPVEPQKEKSSTLPTSFFDNQGTKRQSDDAGPEGRSVQLEVLVMQPKTKEASTNRPPVRLGQMAKKGSQTNTNVKGILPGNFFDHEEDDAPAPKELTSTSGNTSSSNHMQVKGVPDGFFDNNKNGNDMHPSEPSSLSKEAKSAGTAQVKGSLPEGFFDNKDADLRARGIQPQKVDMNDSYKEFEKEIQEDLQEVDDRLEEEEIDAAAERQEYLTLEQQEYRQRVDMLKKQLIESKAARTAKANSKPIGMDTESSSDSSSDEEDDNTDFAVDWRAQHLK